MLYRKQNKITIKYSEMTECKDLLFCKERNETNKPYYIKQFHLDKTKNYDYLYNEYDKLVESISSKSLSILQSSCLPNVSVRYVLPLTLALMYVLPW